MIHTQQHYKGEHSAFYWAHALRLTAWEIDILRRVVRCRYKNQFRAGSKQDNRYTQHL